MLLTGTYTRSIDEKLRVAIPKPLRDLLIPAERAAFLYVAPGTDGSLALYTEEAFARLADQLAEASPTGQAVRDFSRLFFARAQRVEVDRQGRIRVPPELAQWIGLLNSSSPKSLRSVPAEEGPAEDGPAEEGPAVGGPEMTSTESQRENAPLTHEVVLVGVRDHLELWEAERWRAYLAARQAQYDQIAERAFA